MMLLRKALETLELVLVGRGIEGLSLFIHCGLVEDGLAVDWRGL